jgi:uncharacterized protein (DUF4415 family)
LRRCFQLSGGKHQTGAGQTELDKTLEAVTLRLDPETVEHFRAQGADWRKRMARVLVKPAS